MGCKGRARPLHARASGTSTRITCAFHEHGTCALHTARPGTRTCSVFPQRIQLTGAYHHSGRESKDDAKPLHNRERQPLRESKNKNPRIFATFFRLGTPFRPRKAKIGNLWPIIRVFTPRLAIWNHATIRNRKKVAIRAIFLFSSSWGGFRTAP